MINQLSSKYYGEMWQINRADSVYINRFYSLKLTDDILSGMTASVNAFFDLYLYVLALCASQIQVREIRYKQF